jgi:cytochrome c-type biogenesis protein
VETVPLSIALVAGGLAVLNPCGFPLLPAFLSLYVGTDEHALPRAPNRVLQGAAVGMAVAAGFLALFAAVSLPIVYGARVLADAVPWVGVGLGVALVLLGAATFAGRHVGLAAGARPRDTTRRGLAAAAGFGVAYGVASLGCTLPIFLALIGAAVGARGLSVFAAYAAGMTVVLTALAVAAALAKEGLARSLRGLLPYMSRIGGIVLIAAGAYLSYYWLRLELGPQATLADDPVVGLVTRYSARLEVWAGELGATGIAVAAAALAAAVAAALWRARTGARSG